MNRILHRFLSVVFICFFGVFAIPHNAVGNIYLTYAGEPLPENAQLAQPVGAVTGACTGQSGATTMYNLYIPPESDGKISCTSWNCPESDSQQASRHIDSCGGWGDFYCLPGYTPRAVLRVHSYSDGVYSLGWQYECRCGPNEYEYFKTNPTQPHADTDMNFECKPCSASTDSVSSCGYPDPATNAYSSDPDFICDDGAVLVADTNEQVLRCSCDSDNVYLYTHRNGKKSCKTCDAVWQLNYSSYLNLTLNATCGGGNYICNSDYIRSRQDGTIRDAYSGDIYPDDSGYVCVSCNLCGKGIFTNLYTGNIVDSTHSNGCYGLDFYERLGEVTRSQNKCTVTMSWTEVADNASFAATGAACDATQVYDIPGMVMDADYSANKAILDNNNILYALVRTNITQTAPMSYVDGTNGTANALCKKCAEGTVPMSETLQIGACPLLPWCATINSNGVGFYCQEGCFKAFNGQTCYPCPYLGGDNWGNEIFWGISNNSVPGTTNGAYKTSIAECTYNGNNIANKSDLSGSYSWGGSCPVVNSIEPQVITGGSSPSGGTYFTIWIQSNCKDYFANCAFGSGSTLEGYFPGYSSTQDILYLFQVYDQYYITDLTTAQVLTKCALNNRSGCGSDSNFRLYQGSNSGILINLNNF